MKQQRDYAALSAEWQRRAQEKMYEPDAPAAAAPRRPETSLVLAPPAAPQLRPMPAADQAQTIDVRPAAMVETQVHTSQRDHSVGFLIRVLPLAAAFAVAAAVVVVGVFEVPALSMKTIVTIFCVFAAVYLWAFLKDLDASPAGIALRHTRELWKHIHAERKFRHEWYREERKELRR